MNGKRWAAGLTASMHASLSTPGAVRRGIFACQRECRTAARRRAVTSCTTKGKRRKEEKVKKKGRKRRKKIALQNRAGKTHGRNNFLHDFFFGSRDF